jgi:2-dehydro-3-deoxygluconokinase
LENCDLLLPNAEEARSLTGDREPEESARKFLDMGIGTIAIKLGKGGSMLVTDEGRTNIPPFPVREVDPTGAGDSYDAGFICALLWGKSPEEAALFANAVGALSVTKMGGMGGIPAKEEVEGLMARRRKIGDMGVQSCRGGR